jgi:hypothetical protein
MRTGAFDILDRNPGTAFLSEVNVATHAGIFVSTAYFTAQSLGAPKTFIFMVDVPGITHHGSAQAITTNEATVPALVTSIVSKLTGVSYKEETVTLNALSTAGYVFYSDRAGSLSSIALLHESGGYASDFLSNADGTVVVDKHMKSIRVNGAGLYSTDNPVNGVSTSAFIKYWNGRADGINEDDAAFDFRASPENMAEYAPVQVLADGSVVLANDGGLGTEATFFDAYDIMAATPKASGDLLTAANSFGQSISRVMITEVSPDQIRLGIVDTVRSEYDATGNPVNQKYIDFQLGESGINSSGGANPVPFAPRTAYVIAQSLTDYAYEADYASGIRAPASMEGAAVAAVTVPTVGYVAIEDYIEANNVNLYGGMAYRITYTEDGIITNYDLTLPTIGAGSFDLIKSQVELATGGKVTFNDSDDANAATHPAFETVGKGTKYSIDVTGAFIDAYIANNDAAHIHRANAQGVNLTLAMTGLEITFRMNNGMREFSFTATTNDVEQFMLTLNTSMGYNALSKTFDGTNITFTLTSYLVGAGSTLQITNANAALSSVLGFTGANTVINAGAGRPNPDVYVESDGTILIGGDIIRNTITGRPVSDRNTATVHVGYRALRLDLTPSANQPGLLRISSLDELQAVYGPVSSRNPLALGVYFAMLNSAEGAEINAIGVSDISEAEPDGTTFAYKQATEFLRAYEVYTIVPLTASEDVISMFDAHVKNMSDPTERAERALIASPNNPTRRNDLVVLSTGDTGAESTGNLDQVDLNDSPEAVLSGLGVDTAGEIPFALDDDRQLYLALTIGDDLYRYSVKSVDGGRVTVRRTYTTAQNADGYYSTEELPLNFVNAEFSLALRGTVLTLPGSDLLDKTAFSKTIRDKAQQYLNRRQVRLFPDTIQSSAIGGVNQALPSFYFASALAGAVSNIEPQQPLTRVPLVGFNDVIGPDLERSHLDTITAGNAVIEVEVAGQVPALRMQATTDVSTIENREWSITRAVDAFAKTLRTQLKSRIGRFNITQAYMDEFTMLVDSTCNVAVSTGQFRGAVLTKLEQDPAQPDTIIVGVQLEVLFPANYITVTLVV